MGREEKEQGQRSYSRSRDQRRPRALNEFCINLIILQKVLGSMGRDESNLELNATRGNGIGSRRQEVDRKKLSPL